MPIQSGRDRVKQIQEATQTPHTCEKCGGSYFYETRAAQYTMSDYGVRIISNVPSAIYICLCGEPMIAKNLMNQMRQGGERHAFVDSVAQAKAYKESSDLQEVGKNLASHTELEALTKQVKALQGLIDALIEDSTETEVETQKIHAGTIKGGEQY